MTTVKPEPRKPADPGKAVARVLNLEALPNHVDRCDAMFRAFDGLCPGESMVILDDFPLDELKNCLRKNRGSEIRHGNIDLKSNAGRKQILITKNER